MNDWLEDYLEYTRAQEAPEIFHFWSGVAIIASVLNRRVYLPRLSDEGVCYYTNYPGQLSPMLIAGSGSARKSTAITIAKSFMKEAGVKVFDGKITPEQLLAKLSGLPGGQAIMTIVASELSAFMGKQSYNDGLIDILNKLGDCESHPYETKHAIYDLSDKSVCLTIYSGSTPMNLSKAIPPQAQEHGWLSRYVWVYSEGSGKISSLANDEETIDPSLLEESNVKRRSLIIRLRGMRELNGRFKWGPSKKWFDQYYEAYAKSAVSHGEGWPTRRTDHMVRLAMVLNVSRGCQSLTFTDPSDLARADRYINTVEGFMPKCFAFIGQHVNADQQEKIIRVLREAKAKDRPMVKAQDLMMRTARYFPNVQAFKEQMVLLSQSEVIGSIKDPTSEAHFGDYRDYMWTLLKEPY